MRYGLFAVVTSSTMFLGCSPDHEQVDPDGWESPSAFSELECSSACEVGGPLPTGCTCPIDVTSNVRVGPLRYLEPTFGETVIPIPPTIAFEDSTLAGYPTSNQARIASGDVTDFADAEIVIGGFGGGALGSATSAAGTHLAVADSNYATVYTWTGLDDGTYDPSSAAGWLYTGGAITGLASSTSYVVAAGPTSLSVFDDPTAWYDPNPTVISGLGGGEHPVAVSDGGWAVVGDGTTLWYVWNVASDADISTFYPLTYSTAVQDVAVGDVDGDGWDDIVVGLQGEVEVLAGSGWFTIEGTQSGFGASVAVRDDGAILVGDTSQAMVHEFVSAAGADLYESDAGYQFEGDAGLGAAVASCAGRSVLAGDELSYRYSDDDFLH